MPRRGRKTEEQLYKEAYLADEGIRVIDDFDRDAAARFVDLLDSGKVDLANNRVVAKILMLGDRFADQHLKYSVQRYLWQKFGPSADFLSGDDHENIFMLAWHPHAYLRDNKDQKLFTMPMREAMVSAIREVVARRADPTQPLPEMQKHFAAGESAEETRRFFRKHGNKEGTRILRERQQRERDEVLARAKARKGGEKPSP